MAEMSKVELPGGQMQRRDLHFFWLLDGSTSMTGEKIASLNFAVAQAIPGMQSVAKSNPQARLLVRALRFAGDTEWIIGEPTPVAELTWDKDIEAEGETAMGKAVAAVVDELDKLDTSRRFFPPAIILVTDGHATDGSAFEDALRRLTTHKLGKVSQRFAVAIGSNADKDCLRAFIGNDEVPVLEAMNSDDLATMIKIVSVVAIESSSQPLSDSPAAKLDALKKSTGGIDKIDKW
jgi:uncharacterized protein YegL